MKKAKLLLSAFAVLAIVGTTLAFKANSRFGSGTAYCTSTCPTTSLVNFTPGTGTGQTQTPCGVGVQPYIVTGFPAACTATAPLTEFIPTAVGE
jgi:hypothetical protein